MLVLTHTDRVARDQGKVMERRKTTATTATASTATMSTDESCDSSVGAKSKSETEMLMKMIAKEMVASLMREASDAKDEEGEDCGSSVGSGASRVSLNLDIEQIAQMVLSSVDKSGRKSAESDFRKMLREGLEEDGTAPTAVETATDRSVYSKATSRSGSTTTGVSELSNVTGGRKAPMDIFHPNFWNNNAEAEVDCNDAYTQPSNCTTGDSADDSAGAEGGAVGSSIHDFLKSLNHEIHSSDSEDEDDISVLSDMTGLTGCFDDYSEGRRDKSSVAVQSKASKEKSELASIMGSHVGSATSWSKMQKKNRVVSYTVNFTDVQVRQYERIMCDNPASQNGPSVGIGWNYMELEAVPVDDFEHRRGRGTRKASKLLLARDKREKLIRHLGYTDKDIAANVRELNKLRSQRRQTVNNLGAQKVEEAVESAKRQVKKLLLLQRKERVTI